VGEVKTDPILFVDVVIDFETWNRGVPEVRISRNRVVVGQSSACGRWKHGQNLFRHGIPSGRVNKIVRKRISKYCPIRRYTCCRWVEYLVSKHRPSRGVDNGLTCKRYLPRCAACAPPCRGRRNRSTEVPISVGLCRDCRESSRDELAFPELLKIEEEETLVVAVVHLTQEDGSA